MMHQTRCSGMNLSCSYEKIVWNGRWISTWAETDWLRSRYLRILCVFVDHGLLPIFTDRFVQTVHLEFLTHQHCHTIYFKHVLTALYMSVAGHWLSFVHMQILGSRTQVLAADFNNDEKTELYLGGCMSTVYVDPPPECSFEIFLKSLGRGNYKAHENTGLQSTIYEMGSSAGDVGGDGLLNLYVSEGLPTQEDNTALVRVNTIKLYFNKMMHLCCSLTCLLAALHWAGSK